MTDEMREARLCRFGHVRVEKDRRNFERPRLELQDSPSSATEFDRAAEPLVNDEEFPLHSKTVIAIIGI
ncbi:hypothetical protein ANCDUO_00096 [Ancylostoma duodenale]|uniref:Uncharacterized protein n=1 Tax=Ancylostoma duodenale TaxID=51022 RepID=A0A0C2H6P7_9BILA|nr:hypothetical protein ANCDUO_00096 [Ancylostoma duodenale]